MTIHRQINNLGFSLPTFTILFLFIAFTSLGSRTALGEARSDTSSHPIDMLFQQKFDTKDGTVLSITSWKPQSHSTKLPTVLTATPYISDEGQSRARTFAKAGYATAYLDLRGRGGSQGEFFPFSDHGSDICDAIDWIKSQPWSNGEVVMRGGSYRGMSQWMAANTCPTAIATIIPTASVYPGHDYPIVAGQRSQKYVIQWLNFISGKALNSNIFSDTLYWNAKERASYFKHIPASEYDEFVGTPSKHYQNWVKSLSHPLEWVSSVWQPKMYNDIKMPVLTITGHYDGDQAGALRYYKEHLEKTSSNSTNKHYLVMGPWTHGGTRSPQRKLSDDVEFSPDAVFNMDQLNIDWFNWVLGRAPKPSFLKNKIAYYVPGAEEWRYANSLSSISSKNNTLYLSADPNDAYDIFKSGSLIQSPSKIQQPHIFKNDPLDTTPAEITTIDWNDIRDGSLRSAEPAFMPETLIFHSAPFKGAQTIVGQIQLSLHLKMDTPDADIFATVYAIYPDGKPLYLGGDVVRARFRNGLIPELVSPDEINAFEFKNFPWTAWKFPKGTRLRLTVGPYNDPSAQKNYNSGGLLGFETKKDARVSNINLYHDARFPSALTLPIATE